MIFRQSITEGHSLSWFGAVCISHISISEKVVNYIIVVATFVIYNLELGGRKRHTFYDSLR